MRHEETTLKHKHTAFKPLASFRYVTGENTNISEESHFYYAFKHRYVMFKSKECKFLLPSHAFLLLL